MANKVKWDSLPDGEIEVATTVKAQRRGGFLPKPAWITDALKNISNVLEQAEEVDSPNESEEKIQISVKYNRRERVINFDRLDKISPFIEISDDVNFGEDGHPTFESIHKCACELLEDLIVELGVD